MVIQLCHSPTKKHILHLSLNYHIDDSDSLCVPLDSLCKGQFLCRIPCLLNPGHRISFPDPQVCTPGARQSHGPSPFHNPLIQQGNPRHSHNLSQISTIFVWCHPLYIYIYTYIRHTENVSYAILDLYRFFSLFYISGHPLADVCFWRNVALTHVNTQELMI